MRELAATARDLTASGRYAALRFSRETAEAADQDIERAEPLVLSAIRQSAEAAGLPDRWRPGWVRTGCVRSFSR